MNESQITNPDWELQNHSFKFQEPNSPSLSLCMSENVGGVQEHSLGIIMTATQLNFLNKKKTLKFGNVPLRRLIRAEK